MRSHLIIQGPILSYFTAFCPPYAGEHCVQVDGKPAYDANANVLRIAQAVRERFDTVVLSTWDTEPLSESVARSLEALGVIICRPAWQLVDGIANPFKQVVGMNAGLQAIGRLGDEDRVTKTRTDVWFDLLAFVDHAERADESYRSWEAVGQRGFIHAGNSRGPYFLEDMFLSARAADFTRLWQAAHQDPRAPHVDSIHASLPMGYAWRNRQSLHVPRGWFWEYFDWQSPWRRSYRKLLRGKLWRYLMLHCFCLAPEIPAEQFEWRGRASNHSTNQGRMKRFQFFEEWLLLRDHEDALRMVTDLAYFFERQPDSLRGYARQTRNAARTARAILAGG